MECHVINSMTRLRLLGAVDTCLRFGANLVDYGNTVCVCTVSRALPPYFPLAARSVESSDLDLDSRFLLSLWGIK